MLSYSLHDAAYWTFAGAPDTYAVQMLVFLPAAVDDSWVSLPWLLLLQIDITGQRITPDEDVGVYGRSVTFVPASPALPAPFR
jgi:hypothetical protein